MFFPISFIALELLPLTFILLTWAYVNFNAIRLKQVISRLPFIFIIVTIIDYQHSYGLKYLSFIY